jgi:NADPH:quinone reductase-like Zn-dependent oxidoreductase
MKAVLTKEIGGTPTVTDIEVPVPGPTELLVKSLYMAFNPV